MSRSTEQTHRDAHAARHAAIYCRTATTGGAIHTQLKACQTFAREHGYVVPEPYTCLDDGWSGMTLERPGLRRLREIIQTGALHAVIVSDPARLSRQVSHLLLLAGEYTHAAVAMHVVQSPNSSGLDGLRSLGAMLRLMEERGGHA